MSGPPAQPTLAAFLAALALPCVAAAQNPTLLAAPDPDGVLWHDARALFPVMVVTPEPFDSTRTYPAVVMLHGLGGASARFGASPAVKALTDAGFIAILPESPYAMASSAQGGHFSWDLIGSNDPPLVRDPVLQFRSVELFVLDHFPAALGRVRERYRLAPVYAFGFSKGAFRFAHRLLQPERDHRDRDLRFGSVRCRLVHGAW